MSDKRVTVVISDLHVGGGAADPGDDHVYDKQQLRAFIEHLGETEEGGRGDVELIFNGDFLEFAQVRPDLYTLGSTRFWCSEAESLAKLEAITSGHPEIFETLRGFQEAGNLVTVAAGNHDVDLYWPGVQSALRGAAGGISFELGSTWYTRHGGRLLIGHGHMFDPANKFQHWEDPIIRGADGGVDRLEMCAGTIFMVKFVNWLEKDYPFSDNIKPVTALARVLWREDRSGLAVVGWMLTRFLARHPRVAAGVRQMNNELGAALVKLIQFDDDFAEGVARLYSRTRGIPADVDIARDALNSEEELFRFLLEVMALVPPEEWLPVFKGTASGTLAVGGRGGVLAIQAGNKVDKDFLWERANQELLRDDGPQVVVMGHTHDPDRRQAGNGGLYFNPGSWTRYVDYAGRPEMTLADLTADSTFPYELNFVRVEDDGGHRLRATMECFDRSDD